MTWSVNFSSSNEFGLTINIPFAMHFENIFDNHRMIEWYNDLVNDPEKSLKCQRISTFQLLIGEWLFHLICHRVVSNFSTILTYQNIAKLGMTQNCTGPSTWQNITTATFCKNKMRALFLQHRDLLTHLLPQSIIECALHQKQMSIWRRQFESFLIYFPSRFSLQCWSFKNCPNLM